MSEKRPWASPSAARRGKLYRGRRYVRQTTEEMFWKHVHKTAKCWVWTGGLADTGYGTAHVRDGDRVLRRGAHRVSWELHNGKIPGGLKVLHKCDNRKCVRPFHLFLGTDQDNTDDKVRKGRHRFKPHLGEAHGMHKLTTVQVVAARALMAAGVPAKEVAVQLGVTYYTMWDIKRRRSWAHVP